MKTLNWSGYKWYKQEPWGKIHPDKAWNYYDEKAIEVDNDGILHLKTHYNPKTIKHDGKTYNPDYGVGLIAPTPSPRRKSKSFNFCWGVILPQTFCLSRASL